MLPLIAAIPSIISAAAKVTELFQKGRETKQAVTGQPSEASTPEELQSELSSLPQDQQAQWAKIMQQKVDLYAAENQRLALEVGIDSNISAKIDAPAANKIAILRQTTRPWAVRMMVHYVFFPWYLIVIDVVQELFNNWILKGLFRLDGITTIKTFDYVFGTFDAAKLGALGKFVETLKDPLAHTLMARIYAESVPWAVAIIISYMGLREIGKVRGVKDDEGAAPAAPGGVTENISKVITSGADIVGKVKDIFGGRK